MAILIIIHACVRTQSHSHPSSLLPIAPRTAAALPLYTATKILCRRTSRLRGYPVALQRRLLRSLVKSTAASPNTPNVSTMKGTKWWLVSRCAYLANFNCSACAATTPAPFCLRGGDELCKLRLDQVKREEAGYVYYKNGSKNHKGTFSERGASNKVVMSVTVPEAGERCHVYLLDLHIRKLPPDAHKAGDFYF